MRRRESHATNRLANLGERGMEEFAKFVGGLDSGFAQRDPDFEDADIGSILQFDPVFGRHDERDFAVYGSQKVTREERIVVG